ncbi:MAG: hypothetical protein JXA44_08730 [Methanospirillaceae archaeon]|nr:hypothetical protein [Methanospirillaceae archaeon]
MMSEEVQESKIREIKEKAFLLFEQQQYQESCRIIKNLPYHERDTSMLVLEATNLYYLKEFEEARACFLDLATIIPDSVEVHLYLGRILEILGEDTAKQAYADAVRTDPKNREALSYHSCYCIASYDLEGAVPLLKRLISLRSDPTDIKTLMQVYNRLGEYEETVRLYESAGSGMTAPGEYIHALIEGGSYQKAVGEAYAAYEKTHDTCLLRWYLCATTKADLLTGLVRYKTFIETNPDSLLASDFISVLLKNNRPSEAVAVYKEHLAGVHTPACIRAGCRAYADFDPDRASRLYESALSDDSYTGEESSQQLQRMIHEYRLILTRIHSQEEAERIFFRFATERKETVYLLEAGAMCQESGDMEKARSWFFLAFKTDFIAGGLPFARFLMQTHESREAEKTLLYIIKNTRTCHDIEEVALYIMQKVPASFTLDRVRNAMQQRLSDNLTSLSTKGRAWYAQSLAADAEHLLLSGDTNLALIQCLTGLAIVPSGAFPVSQDLYQILLRCKERDLITPDIRNLFVQEKRESRERIDLYTLLPFCTPEEMRVLLYIKEHSPCYERDIREYLGTRRAAGIINRLIVKCREKGITIIKKEGYGDAGEIYRYVGP